MKCEKVIGEAVFLRPKCYCLKEPEVDGKAPETAKAKGISLRQNAASLNFDSYKKSLDEIEQVMGKNIQILKTSSTVMETAEQEKVALTPYDDKRIWISKTLSEPYGLHDTPYNSDEVFARIVDNCANRVMIARRNFVEILGCSELVFRKQIEDSFPPYCSLLITELFGI